jgi:hypothetical protein
MLRVQVTPDGQQMDLKKVPPGVLGVLRKNIMSSGLYSRAVLGSISANLEYNRICNLRFDELPLYINTKDKIERIIIKWRFEYYY